MKKAMGFLAGAAMAGGAAYILMNKNRRDKAEKMICNAIEDANNMISKKMN